MCDAARFNGIGKGANEVWKTLPSARPPPGLYSPRFEHDNCGIGAVVDIKGRKSHKTIDDALQIVEHLEHRAGKDAEGKTGDGVGILTQISDKFFQKAAAEQGLTLGAEREYGIGMFFFPQDELKRNQAKKLFEIVCKKEGLPFLGWREVPTCPEVLGHKAIACMPSIWQGFVGKPQRVEAGIAFDRRLYVARRVFEQSSPDTYVCSLSSRTIVYKGMFLVKELRLFYPDLQDADYESAIGMVHSRFSTNTSPSWNRAQPNRFILHNGEINTIRGNVDTMLAREETIGSDYLKDDMTKVPAHRQQAAPTLPSWITRWNYGHERHGSAAGRHGHDPRAVGQQQVLWTRRSATSTSTMPRCWSRGTAPPASCSATAT